MTRVARCALAAVALLAACSGPARPQDVGKPATGVKGSQVVNLAKDLARSLSLVSIRVVETIPGKNYMALELPNARRQTIKLTEVLEQLRGRVTTLTIAHRLSTVRRCDRLCYLEQGRIVAEGSLDRLYREIPGFARMVELARLA